MFDPMGFLRMTLLCSFWHEMGHGIMYWIFTKKMPVFSLQTGGAVLKNVNRLSKWQEFWVICAGPFANFLLAALLYLWLQQRASFTGYFLVGINICIGFYNLLPLPVLDGGRICRLWMQNRNLTTFIRFQQLLLWIFFAVNIGLIFLSQMPWITKIAGMIGCGYLLIQEYANE